MYRVSRLAVRAFTQRTVSLPFRLRIGLAGRGSEQQSGPANLLRCVHALLGGEWGVTQSVFDTRIWAPRWTDDDLRAFLEKPLSAGDLGREPLKISKRRLRALRTASFPMTHGNPETRFGDAPLAHEADIVYFNGLPSNLGFDYFLYDQVTRKRLFLGAVRDSLLRAGTRLLILHHDLPEDPQALDPFEGFANGLVSAGVPAVLTVCTRDRETAETYFYEALRNVTHDLPLDESFAVRPDNDALAVTLTMASDSSLLSLQPWAQKLHADLQRVENTLVARRLQLDKIAPMLHRSQQNLLAQSVTEQSSDLSGLRDGLSDVHWGRESEGVIPLARIARNFDVLHQRITPSTPADGVRLMGAPDWREAARQMKKTPRVLNAALQNELGQDLTATQGLLSGTNYALAVQIGPRWTLRASLVAGVADFPESAVPDNSHGNVLDVFLVSDDLEPRLVKAQLWLPQSGPSSPYPNAETVAPLPALLPFQAPRIEDGASKQIDARLCIYLENNLLQSAVMRIGVVATDQNALPFEQAIHVDYALTGSFVDTERFAKRAFVQLNGEPETLPITINLMQNSGLGDGHRIIVKGSDLPPVWRRYDPQGNSKALQNARADLKACFRDGDAQTRTLDSFKDDLFKLASRGYQLYTQAFGQLDDVTNLYEYLGGLREVLKSKAVIQNARSGLAQYVFPWAMIYDYPLPNFDKPRYCQVFQETSTFPWATAPRDRCKYDGEDWHKADIYCPYGFWGFRHIIEQPLAAVQVGDTQSKALSPADSAQRVDAAVLELTVGVTNDPAILAQVSDHVIALEKIAPLKPRSPATSWKQVGQMLGESRILYFLCHGEFDADRSEPYLGIGKTAATVAERVYPSLLMGWGLQVPPPPLAHHPLVIINGCHTCDLTADQLLNFVTAFSQLGASGVVGTEVSVPVQFATQFAQQFLARLKDHSVGQAIYETRWDFALNGNLLGLIYTPYCLADLTAFGPTPA